MSTVYRRDRRRRNRPPPPRDPLAYLKVADGANRADRESSSASSSSTSRARRSDRGRKLEMKSDDLPQAYDAGAESGGDDADADGSDKFQANVSDVIQAARKAATSARYYANHGHSQTKSKNGERSTNKETASSNARASIAKVVRARPIGYSGDANSPEHIKHKSGRLPPPRQGSLPGAPRVVVSPPSSSSHSSSATSYSKKVNMADAANTKRSEHSRQRSKGNGPLLPGASKDIMDLLNRASALRNDSASFLKGKTKPHAPSNSSSSSSNNNNDVDAAIVPLPTTPTNRNPSKKRSPNSPPLPPTALSDAQIVENARSAANKGNPAAQFRMGVISEKGKNGVTRDYGEALRWYSLAAGAVPTPHAKALCNLGRMYQLGLGVEPSDAVAVRYFTRASELGDPKATYNLAMCYKVGSGVEADSVRALEHLSRAASLGSKAASFHLGLTLERGDETAGVKRDSKGAVQWYVAAADKGCTKSLTNLGVMYVKGAEDLPRNDVLAVRYLKKAVDSGDPAAALNLGKMCEAGRGGPAGADENAAIKYVQIAAEGGHVKAQCKLGGWHKDGGPEGSGIEDGGNWKEARKWYRLAARQGHAGACVELGKMYVEGQGVPSNAKVAIKHFRVAAEKGHVEGMFLLGRTLCDGVSGKAGVSPNPKAGIGWVRKASKKGSVPAKRFLETMTLLPEA